jgi:uncharacterized membrane protein (DUF485 family)
VLDWVCTILAVAAYFAYILVIAYRPEIFRSPIGPNTLVSIGIASGVALTIFLVALAGIYAALRNRRTSK